MKVSELKDKWGLEGITLPHTTSLLSEIAEDCRNIKSNLFCCFVDFRKDFDTVPRNNLWNRLEELKVPIELRVVVIMLYEKVIAKFKSTE